MKINYPDNEEFYSLHFYVDKRVLIPRNDTEILVERVLKEITQDTTLIDVGTGSGAIPIAIAKNRDIDKIFALDISFDALEVAKINWDIHQLQDKIEWIHSDLLEKFLKPPHSPLSGGSSSPDKGRLGRVKTLIITANLPYIKDGDIENMDKEVLENEPHIALFGGPKTGFEMYERLIKQVFELKKIFQSQVILFIEIWFDQYEYSFQYLSSLWLKFEYFKDFNNIYRVIKINFN